MINCSISEKFRQGMCALFYRLSAKSTANVIIILEEERMDSN